MKKLERKNEVYWKVDEKGAIVDDPYYPKCFEVDKIQVRLITVSEKYATKKCPQCDLGIDVKK